MDELSFTRAVVALGVGIGVMTLTYAVGIVTGRVVAWLFDWLLLN